MAFPAAPEVPARSPGHHLGRPGARAAPTLPHLDGLDGIRAFAVLAVMGVHQEFGWMPGGFYGVDAFFTLSGFLITSLLLQEVAATGTIRLGAFWARRARRLLPALVLLVLVVGLVSAFAPTLLPAPSFPGALATLFYSANWYYAFQHVNYFVITGTPSPLLHTWSLAIEEQFYVVWPLIVLGALHLGRRRGAHSGGTSEEHLRSRMRLLLGLALAGALGGAIAMWLTTPVLGNPSAAYYGTGTRAQGILIGAALALALALWGPPRRRAARRALGLAGVAGALGTVLLWRFVPETSPLAFHGGFLLAGLGTAVVVANVASAPRGRFSRFLGLAPLRRLGVVSYGVYLWYWPVTIAMSPQRLDLGPYALFGARLAVTVGLAVASYVLVEAPIRYGRIPRRTVAWALPVGVVLAAGAMFVGAVIQPVSPSGQTAASTLAVAKPSPASGRDVKVLLVGDSAAGSLGVGLGALAPRYGIQLMNDGHPGCSATMTGLDRVLWYTVPPGKPCSMKHPDAIFDSWQHIVDTYNPDVVVYLARSDLLDQTVGGRWEHVGESSFDTYLRSRLSQMVAVLSSRGAAVVLLTEPYYDAGNGGADPWPEDQPARVVAANQVIRQVAAHPGDLAPRSGSLLDEVPAASATSSGARAVSPENSPSKPRVSVFNLGALVSPGGHFADDVDGVDVRCDDGVHFTAPGGQLVARHLLPVVRQLGLVHHQASPGGAWAGPPPPTTPSWWFRLPCG